MQLKIVALFCLLCVTISYPADSTKTPQNINAPSSNNFIGKTYTKIKDIDSALTSGEFSTLYQDKNYAISVHGSKRVLDSSRYPRFNYVFFTKTVGYKDKKSILQILDVITIDTHDFNDSATIALDECECKGKDQCQTAAIYNREIKMAKKGIKVKPLKVWRPNITTGKLEELSPENVRCGEQEPEEE